ncbi:LysM domain-containing protein [Alkalibaculum bacchi]|uniref:LysM domain-containing protein n=1 Tax=Alkalibaculum bacchi TaxID=645887 RepID=A0A366HXD6_9FIRM|nr:glycoside hydrolase family 25 protein [Alkalibaculum bacchi]RBP57934.1 LysM domain-containing protein [Alkalibaculum bacchi]
MGYIIDISHHQNPSRINYRVLCRQLDMAIVRVQFGSSLIDRHYRTHIREMKENTVPVGVYAWVRGINLRDMEVEAADFYNRSKDLNPEFYVLDVEEKSMNNMRVGINAYINKMRTLTDKKIGIYVGHHLYNSFNLDMEKADFVWIPHYGVNNGTVNSTPRYPCDLHQYTSVGRLDGYNDNLDFNRLMNGRTLEFFIGKSDNLPEKPNNPEQDPTANEIIYTIKKGDTLWDIARLYNTTVEILANYNNISNTDLIYAGNQLRIPISDNIIIYTIKRGDTLYGIAYQYNTTVDKLVRDNNIANRNLIYPGQVIRIVK